MAVMSALSMVEMTDSMKVVRKAQMKAGKKAEKMADSMV